MVLTSRSMLLALLVPLGLVACAESPSDAPSPAPILDGAYYSESGPIAWTVFKGEEYLTWRRDPACDDRAADANACEERGTFTHDVDEGMLTLSSTTGRVSVQAFKVTGTATGKAQPFTGGSTKLTSLVEGGQALTSSNVVSGFELQPTQLLAAGEVRKFFLVCRVVGMILQPPTQPIIVPTLPQPPPIERECASQG